jgi:antitoxin VapB
MAKTAKVFMSGRSQAVRLPAALRFRCREVLIEKKGKGIVLTPKETGWADFFSRTSAVPPDFLADREDALPESRKLF